MAAKNAAIEAQREAMREQWKIRSWLEGQAILKAQQAQELPPGGTKVLVVPIKQDNPPNWLDNFLANKYTPVVSGAICVLATEAAFVLLAASVTPLAPATLTLVGICWGVGRIAALTSVISTGYQYNHGLYETTKFDTQIALITYGFGSVPTPEMAAMNSVGFIYTAYTTFWRNK